MFFLVFVGYAQHPELLNKEWYAQEVTVDGTTYERPLPDFRSIVYFINTAFEVAHLSCSEGYGSDVTYVNQDEFSILDGSPALIGNCTDPLELQFIEMHYKLYLENLTTARNPFTYTISPGSNGNTLVVTNVDGDVGIYGDVLLSNVDFNELSISIYPNPATDEISILGPKVNSGYSLFSILGNEVARGDISVGESINVRHLQSGLYILQLENGRTGKVIIE